MTNETELRDREEMLERIKDIEKRRTLAFGAGSGKGLTTAEHLALIPEATTQEDIDTIHEAVDMLDEFSKSVLSLHSDVWREFGKYRCAVCGRTQAQNEAIGYNCALEC